MIETQALLLFVLKHYAFDTLLLFSKFPDWTALLQESIDQTVVGLVVPAVREYAKDHDVPNLDRWYSIGDQLVAYFACCFQAQRELVNMFEDNEIPFVIIKGYAAAVNYPVPKLRTMGDNLLPVVWVHRMFRSSRIAGCRRM